MPRSSLYERSHTLQPYTIVNRTIDDRFTALLGGLGADHPAAISSQEDHVGQVESAIRQACCVCCATLSTTPFFRFKWVRPGNHITLVGSYKLEMAEVYTTPIRRAHILVDSCSAYAPEAGELIGTGHSLAAEDMVEVGELMRSTPAGGGVD
jgi:ornithine cyclodeaminase/alanine dehydrogenase-like protein (mu-crystallin family)